MYETCPVISSTFNLLNKLIFWMSDIYDPRATLICGSCQSCRFKFNFPILLCNSRKCETYLIIMHNKLLNILNKVIFKCGGIYN